MTIFEELVIGITGYIITTMPRYSRQRRHSTSAKVWIHAVIRNGFEEK